MPENNKPSNQLLAALTTVEYQRMLPKLEEVPLIFKETIYELEEIIRHIYFPNSGIVSLLSALGVRTQLEVGIVGREGMVGLPTFLGVKTSNNYAIVQGAGSAFRIKTADFIAECKKTGSLSSLVLRYTHSLLSQVSQSAVCYRFHPVDARLARWLLMSCDRMESDDFKITQDFLSKMLGVRREAVNKAIGELQKRQLIEYNRELVKIINRPDLEKVTCQCYAIIRDEEKSFPV